MHMGKLVPIVSLIIWQNFLLRSACCLFYCFLGCANPWGWLFQPASMAKQLIYIRKQLNWTMKMLCTGPTVHLPTLSWKSMEVPYRILQRLLKLIQNIQRHASCAKIFLLSVLFFPPYIWSDVLWIQGYYRRGAAYLAMGKFKEALKDFQQVFFCLCSLITTVVRVVFIYNLWFDLFGVVRQSIIHYLILLLSIWPIFL